MHASLENVEIKVLLYQSKNLQTVILTFIWSKIAIQWWQSEIKSGGGRRLKIKLDIPSPPPPPPPDKKNLRPFFVRQHQHLSVSGIWIMEYWEWATNTLDQYYLEWHQQQKLHRTAFHRPVGEGGSAD